MASGFSGNNDASSSATSLQTTDIIPREYHRKVLKKIAQLTKVEKPVYQDLNNIKFKIIIIGDLQSSH